MFASTFEVNAIDGEVAIKMSVGVGESTEPWDEMVAVSFHVNPDMADNLATALASQAVTAREQ